MKMESKLVEESKVYKPFKFPWAMEMAENHEDLHWTEKEINLSDDVTQWKDGTLSDVEKNHITQILRLFTQSDVVVAGNYCDMFVPIFRNNEIRSMLLSFAAREGVHQRAYALLNDTLGLHESEYSMFLEYDAMVDKVDFMKDADVHTQHGLAKAVALSVFNEGVSLFSAFVMLLNYQRMGKMKGMNTVVEWSIRDETMHCEGMSKLFREFCTEHPRIVNDEFKKDIYEMARQIVKLESKVIDLAFEGGDIDGLDKGEVKTYIKYLADRRLIQMGLKGNFKVKENPLPWVEQLTSGDSMSNFFEKTVTDYSAVGMTGDWGWE
ncbi:MAG: ribonucleotide-diphosphate reductase subunit beta [Deltaproteobacteria bacterium]|nr:ribonucleotide-diphosphate reductase subunit beta [Deltaproteobacteria bacterium]